MGIRNRLLDAHTLWANGRKEGALMMVLFAIAATSRRRYPQSKCREDNRAFKSFVSDEMPKLTACLDSFPSLTWSIAFRGEMYGFEDFLYRFLRNTLAHEGSMPPDVEFGRPPFPTAIYPKGTGLLIDPALVVALSEIVTEAPENDDEFPNPDENAVSFVI